MLTILAALAQLVTSVAVPILVFYANAVRTDLRELRKDAQGMNVRLARVEERTERRHQVGPLGVGMVADG